MIAISGALRGGRTVREAVAPDESALGPLRGCVAEVEERIAGEDDAPDDELVPLLPPLCEVAIPHRRVRPIRQRLFRDAVALGDAAYGAHQKSRREVDDDAPHVTVRGLGGPQVSWRSLGISSTAEGFGRLSVSTRNSRPCASYTRHT